MKTNKNLDIFTKLNEITEQEEIGDDPLQLLDNLRDLQNKYKGILGEWRELYEELYETYTLQLISYNRCLTAYIREGLKLRNNKELLQRISVASFLNYIGTELTLLSSPLDVVYCDENYMISLNGRWIRTGIGLMNWKYIKNYINK